jgi:hypothetical protein
MHHRLVEHMAHMKAQQVSKAKNKVISTVEASEPQVKFAIVSHTTVTFYADTVTDIAHRGR